MNLADELLPWFQIGGTVFTAGAAVAAAISAQATLRTAAAVGSDTNSAWGAAGRSVTNGSVMAGPHPAPGPLPRAALTLPCIWATRHARPRLAAPLPAGGSDLALSSLLPTTYCEAACPTPGPHHRHPSTCPSGPKTERSDTYLIRLTRCTDEEK